MTAAKGPPRFRLDGSTVLLAEGHYAPEELIHYANQLGRLRAERGRLGDAEYMKQALAFLAEKRGPHWKEETDAQESNDTDAAQPAARRTRETARRADRSSIRNAQRDPQT